MSIKRALVIGAGHVGSTSGYALILKKLVDVLEIIDLDETKLNASIADLNHAASFENISVRKGSYDRLNEYDFVIITAGTSQSGITRLLGVEKAKQIISSIAENFKNRDFKGKVIIASNPLDIMTHYFLKCSNLPKEQVIGTGTLLDTARYKAILAEEFSIPVKDIDANVYGEHGDSSFIDLSNTTLKGRKLTDILVKKNIDEEKFRERIEKTVRFSGYAIVLGQGATYYGIGNTVAEIVEALSSKKERILPLCTLVTGEYSLDDVCVSLPVRILESKLEIVPDHLFSEIELEKLNTAVKLIKENSN